MTNRTKEEQTFFSPLQYINRFGGKPGKTNKIPGCLARLERLARCPFKKKHTFPTSFTNSKPCLIPLSEVLD